MNLNASLPRSPKPALPGGLGGWRAAGCGLLLIGLAACRGDQEQARLELERRGVAVTAAGLHEAVEAKNAHLLVFYARAGVRAEPPAEGEPSLLHLAAAQEDWPLVGRLLTFCDPGLVNHKGPAGRVILEQAVIAGQFPLAEALLGAGALPDRSGACPDEVIQHASRSPGLMDQLLAALPASHPALGPALWRAVAAGETERVVRLLDQGAPVDARDPKGRSTALEMACTSEFEGIARLLVRRGAQPSASPAALGVAVQRRNLNLARLLLEAGAEVNPPAPAGLPDTTPLKTALDSGQTAMVALMLEHGADPGICQDHAFAAGDAALLDLMIGRGLAFDRPGADGNPPLVRAAIEGHAALITRLLEKGAPPMQTGVLGQTAYHMAVIHRKAEAVEALLAAGVAPDSPFLKPAPEALLPLFESDYFVKWYGRDEGLTPLMLAAARGDTAQLRQLLKAGAKRGAQTKAWHRYPIVFACDTVNIPAAQILLGRNPDDEREKRHAVISLSRQRVTLFKNDQPVRSSKVSTGKHSTPTPPGQYVITDKQAHWVSSIYKVPMPFFMRLSCKEIGLHAGVVPGYPASHGCIRLPKGEVQAFFRTLKIGDPVTIEP